MPKEKKPEHKPFVPPRTGGEFVIGPDGHFEIVNGKKVPHVPLVAPPKEG